DGAQAPDDVSRLFEPPHMGIAGGKGPVCRWEARFLLYGEEEVWYRLVVSPAGEMRGADKREGKADARTGLRRSEASTCSIARSGCPAINLMPPL
ncbi:MAG TPA: hypothetical protein VIM52_10885, partial [Stellaceae bacterium]